MRGSELIGARVRGPRGEDLGRVLDVRCVPDGPVLGGRPALRLDALVVGRRQVGARLGYHQHERGPALLRALVLRLVGPTFPVPWADVRTVDAGAVLLARLPSGGPAG